MWDRVWSPSHFKPNTCYRPILHDKEKGIKSHKMARHHRHGHEDGHELGKLKRQYSDYYESVTNVGVWFEGLSLWFVNLLSAEQKNHTQILLRWLSRQQSFFYFFRWMIRRCVLQWCVSETRSWSWNSSLSKKSTRIFQPEHGNDIILVPKPKVPS